MENVKVWLIFFSAVFFGGWALLAFIFWQVTPESYAFFRIWGLTSAGAASIAAWLSYLGRSARLARK